MKTKTLASLTLALLSSASSQAAISGINTPFNSLATIRFGDGNSFNGSLNGGTYSPPVAIPWNGSLYATPTYTDFTTNDSAEGSVVASWTPGSYALNYPIADLSQAIGNTGSAILEFVSVVEFQTDAAGFPLSPTFFPTFFINGTVQPGGFANLTGTISYTSAAAGLLDTVNYNYNNLIPGSFGTTVTGVPNIGSTPALIPFDTLMLISTITFTVDPATISATTVPEPTASLLALLAAAPLLLRRRRA
jgi:hypothetical protein